MKFMVDKVALTQIFLPSTSGFPCQYHSASAPYIFNYMSLLPAGQIDED